MQTLEIAVEPISADKEHQRLVLPLVDAVDGCEILVSCVARGQQSGIGQQLGTVRLEQPQRCTVGTERAEDLAELTHHRPANFRPSSISRPSRRV